MSIVDNMALNNNDKDWIRQEFKDSAAQPVDKFKTWFPPAAVIAMALFLLTQWGEYNKFRGATEAKLTSIESKLSKLASAAASIKIDDLAELSTEEFSSSLGSLRNALAEKPQLTPESVRKVSLKLQSVDAATPKYWLTVMQFLQSSSEVMTPALNVPPPTAHTLTLIGLDTRTYPVGSHLDYKNIVFDGGVLKDFTIKNSRITFTNNPVQLSNVRFIDCVFEMPIIDNPGNHLKASATQLLASNLGQIDHTP